MSPIMSLTTRVLYEPTWCRNIPENRGIAITKQSSGDIFSEIVSTRLHARVYSYTMLLQDHDVRHERILRWKVEC